MYGQEILLKIKPLLEAQLAKGGYTLVDLRFFKDRQHQRVLELLVDRCEGGITLDECVRLNRELGDCLETGGIIQEGYILDISSPGLDRPLVTACDFRRYIGHEVRVFLKTPVEGKIEYIGHIESVSETNLLLNIGKKTIQISLGEINKAKQVIL